MEIGCCYFYDKFHLERFFFFQNGLSSALSEQYKDLMGNVDGPLSSFYSGKFVVVRGILETVVAFKEKIVLVSYFTQVSVPAFDSLRLTNFLMK